MVITIGPVEGAPRKPAPMIENPIRKNNDVNRSLEKILIPSRLRSLGFAFDTYDNFPKSFLALSSAHAEYLSFLIHF